MNTLRSLWLGSHLLTDPAGAAAHEEAAALGPAVHERLLAAGDRLAAASATLAQQYYRQAAAAWKSFGSVEFDRWFTLGEKLATSEPVCRDGAAAYFAVPPSGFGRGGLKTATAWCRLGRELAMTSPKLSGIFFKTTAVVLRKPGGMAQLQSWVEVGIDVYRRHGWQGEFLAQAYFASAPRALSVLCPSVYRLWAGAGVAVYPEVREREFFGNLPRGLRRWTESEQLLLLQTTLTLAATAPLDAYVFYRDLPTSIERVGSPAREVLLRVLARAGRRVAGALAEVVPVVGVLVQAVPAAHVLEALGLVEAVAAQCPEAATAALRALSRVYEEADRARVREWFNTGMSVARDNPQAGLAYFALESRTSLRVLRAASTAASLEESQGLLRKYVQMLSGEPVSIRPLEGLRLRLPLEEFPAENEIALPMRVDLLGTHEDNLRFYRFLAAQLAGRREFGTYSFVPPGGDLDPDEPPGSALARYLADPERPKATEPLFLLAEGVRIHHRLCAAYGGLVGEGWWVATRLLDRWKKEPSPASGQRLDLLFALMLLGSGEYRPPGWLAGDGAALVRQLVAPLARPEATVQDSMRVAEALATEMARLHPLLLESGRELDGFSFDTLAGEAMFDEYMDHEDAMAPDEAPWVRPVTEGSDSSDAPEEFSLELTPAPDDGAGASQQISPEELKRLLEAGVDLQITQGAGADADGVGLYITDLLGKLPKEQIEALRQLLGDPEPGPRRMPKRWLDDAARGNSFWYDEWDYHIGDYRSRWCRLYEVGIEGDSGEFFTQALGDYARLIPEVRRQFQQIRPEMYRTVRGLEDGEDFDLNAAIAARVDLRAGSAPSSKLYVARKREERDVATLFLLDMSASTDEPLVKPPPAKTSEEGQRAMTPAVRAPAARRIIDVTKETLVIMAEALEEIGDAYAIYGFSGHGRDNVEVYRVKSFAEPLSATVKARLGGIEPKRSTRMGTALRHAVEKMTAVNSRCKHLFLLSDGFPQDFDYGQDRRSNVYGIRDTATALREAEAAGVTPFCITVDKAGHDYLRQMCDESRYMVIKDITELPRELPKIYQRVVRG